MKIKYAKKLVCTLMAAFAMMLFIAGSTPAAQASIADDTQCKTGPTECVPTIRDPALKDCTNTDCNIVQKYLNPFIRLLTIFVGIAVVIGIIVGGIQYAASAGDPQKVTVAKRHIRNSVVALIVFFFLYAFIRFLAPGGVLTN